MRMKVFKFICIPKLFHQLHRTFNNTSVQWKKALMNKNKSTNAVCQEMHKFQLRFWPALREIIEILSVTTPIVLH